MILCFWVLNWGNHWSLIILMESSRLQLWMPIIALIHIIGRKRRNSFLGILHCAFISSYTHMFSETVMVATVRCEEIANEKFRQLTCDEVWLELEEAIQAGPVPGFGKKLSSILETIFSRNLLLYQLNFGKLTLIYDYSM
ncbi:hypothetical protein UlMin_026355 [Ulmus minor]